MSTDRDFDRIAMAWLAEGPDELSDRVLDTVVDRVHLTRQRRVSRVPWRFPTMTMPARVAALIAVGVLVLAGMAAIAGVGSRSTPVESTAPTSAIASTAVESAAPGSSAVGLPALDQTFTSGRHGYSVGYPTGWTVTPATDPWPQGSQAPQWGDPNADEIKGSSLGSTHPSGDIRLIGTGQPFADGQTGTDWVQAYCDCDPSSLRTTKVAGYDGYVTLDGVGAAAGTILPGGKVYEVAVAVTDRGYVFTLDGNVDLAMFDRFLTSVDFMPSDAVDTPPLTGRFTSPTYGYSIGTLPDWKTTPGTQAWTTISNDAPFDSIDITGTPQGVGVASQPLGDRVLYDFLTTFEAGQARVGCSGGSPAQWESVQIGDKSGFLDLECNGAEAFAQAGDRVYLFEWHAAEDGSTPFSLAAFKQLLTSVEFDPASAK